MNPADIQSGARSASTLSPGRSCPLHYRYAPEALDRAPVIHADTLYVIGGLYGNLPALSALRALASRESMSPQFVFNGDFNWFNVDPGGFRQINETVLEHLALRGNVETEIAGDDAGAGCGCAYPDDVADAEVEFSNRIIERLRRTARDVPDIAERLLQLPMQMTVEVGGISVGVVHGDAESLAGWGFAHDALADERNHSKFGDWFRRANVRVFACSHTCLPALHEFDLPGGTAAVINNGAAGMPNFSGAQYGVITRIGLTPAPAGRTLYGSRIDGAFIDALRLDYDHALWLRNFLADWPEGSPAHSSYFRRIVSGPAFTIDQALGNRQRRTCGD
ncbi:MAG: hypothetical protein HY067_05020 [Betaproteobacteria bacterium]|nr:hypothetical protein [Betaproteobacteria bacterium]